MPEVVICPDTKDFTFSPCYNRPGVKHRSMLLSKDLGKKIWLTKKPKAQARPYETSVINRGLLGCQVWGERGALAPLRLSDLF